MSDPQREQQAAETPVSSCLPVQQYLEAMQSLLDTGRLPASVGPQMLFLTRTASEIHALPGLVTFDRYFSLPVDYSRTPEHDCVAVPLTRRTRPTSGRLTVFARHVVAASKRHEIATLPWLIYFQGGPGFESPRVTQSAGWMATVLEKYQVLLLDQRGTGLSSPITATSLTTGRSVQAQLDYIVHFRADSIVRDAEEIRKTLLRAAPLQKWAIFGQSFGGFCVTHYLSKYSESITEAFLTGGLPPLVNHPDAVYESLYQRVIEHNERYYNAYPEDVARVNMIVQYLKDPENEATMPNGERLSIRRFRQLGLFFGFQGGFERTHYLILDAFGDSKSPTSPAKKSLSYRFLNAMQNMFPFETNPIYAILHESIYCQNGAMSDWSAERVLKQHTEWHDYFCSTDPDKPFYFSGEMIYSDMLNEYPQLRPLKEVAHQIAKYKTWPALYDLEKLRNNTVPCAAVVFLDDMYVDMEWSLRTSKAIRGLKVWVTNEYAHSAINDNGGAVLAHLLNMLHS